MPAAPEDFFSQHSEYNPVVLQLLYNRGIFEKKQIEEFFNPSNDFFDPMLFKDMEAAVGLIIKHIKLENPIVVYGDFDADGITAAAVLVETLSTFKAKTEVYIPDRASEGYGLNKNAIKELAKRNKLIITVDTGIRNKEEVEYAKSLGFDVIVTDHHEGPKDKKELPDCLIINPMIEKDFFGKNLAGVGVAYKLAKALIERSKLEDKYKNQLENRVMDLVAVGTIADCVSLKDENRRLARRGLEILNQRKRVGFDELIKVSQLNGNKEINSWNVSWQISPRLNSAGRLDHANTAYELLITKDRDEAKKVAEKLNEKNSERQKVTDELFQFCKKKVESGMQNDKILVLLVSNFKGDQNVKWLGGIVGLVAGRLCECYSRPVLVITKIGEEIRGSGRSIEGFDINRAIEEAKEYLSKYGGHAAACGFTLKSENYFDGFKNKVKAIAKKELKNIDLAPKLEIEAEIKLDDLDDKVMNDINKFEPFGEDNPKPRFMSRGIIIKDKMLMGTNGQHVKFRLNGFWALAFGQSETWKDLRIGDKIDIVYCVEFNEFNGRRDLQLKAVDIKKSK